MNKDFDKFSGCLLGGAAGDALGYPIEFWDEKEIFTKYGDEGISQYCLDYDSGEALISDDTQMTLFTAEGIVQANDPCDDASFIQSMYAAYQEWYETQTHQGKQEKKIWLSDIPELNQHRAPGNTCMSALGRKKYGDTENPINNSKGCGGVMRVAPIGLYYSPEKQTLSVTDRYGADAAALTHGHPLGYMSAAGLVHIVNLAVYRSEMSLLDIVNDMIEKVPLLYMDTAAGYCLKFQELMRKAVELSQKGAEIKDVDAIHLLGEGWVGEEALTIAVYCSLRYSDSFDKALRAAVNHNGDSDSTGAITGNILGAYLGTSGIPEKYLKNLELHDVILRVASELYEKA